MLSLKSTYSIQHSNTGNTSEQLIKAREKQPGNVRTSCTSTAEMHCLPWTSGRGQQSGPARDALPTVSCRGSYWVAATGTDGSLGTPHCQALPLTTGTQHPRLLHLINTLPLGVTTIRLLKDTNLSYSCVSLYMPLVCSIKLSFIPAWLSAPCLL